jgi:hypothetical protein
MGRLLSDGKAGLTISDKSCRMGLRQTDHWLATFRRKIGVFGIVGDDARKTKTRRG